MFRLVALAAVLAAVSVAAEAPAVPPSCNLSAVAPWVSAGEGYRAQAMTSGQDCASATLDLALVSPQGRALWERHYSATTAVRQFYGVPGRREMQSELEVWIAPAEGKPGRSSQLPEWPEGAAGPAGFEPAAYMTQFAWSVLRDAALPLFCFNDAPGFQTCVAISKDDTIDEIGRRATR